MLGAKTMKRSKYNIFHILRNLKQKGISPGKKQFQKIIYLVENVGYVKLGYSYIIHYYGPYSAALDDTLAELEGECLFHYEYQGLSHLICADDLCDIAKPDLNDKEIDMIEKIIETFKDKSPSELELLTTSHFIRSKLKNANDEENRVIEGVKKIKGSKYSDEEIRNALKELNAC
jgi:uncharacterized protein YwgA